MSAGMPELGSKISLISKADIRYEGRLFTVDPQECTIALANVRSFGTEDREAECLVAPQNQVYDYILFRGSDIKDIRVVNNIGPLPNDPAIVQLSVPPSLGTQPYQPTGFSHPVMGHMGHVPQYPAYGQMGPIGGMPSGMAPGMGMYRDPRAMMQKQQSELVNPVHAPDHGANKDQELIGGSRPTTPGLSAMTRKSPTVDQGVQVNHTSPVKDDKKPPQRQVQQRDPRELREQYQREPIQREQTNREPIQREQHPREQREHHREQHREQREQVPREQREHREQREQHTREPREHREPREQREPREHREPREPREQRDQHPREHREYQAREQNAHQRDQQGMPMHPQGQRGGWMNRGGVRRGRGRGGVPGMGFNRPLQPAGLGGKPKNTLKFENDYDFEQANTEFEELRTQLAKIKVDGVEITSLVVEGASTSVAPEVAKVNGEVNDKKEDSGNETGTAEGELEEDPDSTFYDKTKSFFDNISCEAVERSKGRSQRTDWRMERKLNSETFGVSARRGAFRGRGGYYNNRGMGGGGGGGMYRGNFRGGYRGGQGGPRGGQRGGASAGGANGIQPLIQQRPLPQAAEVK